MHRRRRAGLPHPDRPLPGLSGKKIVGLGEQGARVAAKRDTFVGRSPALAVRPVVNTIGAGDALFAAFVRCYAATRGPLGITHAQSPSPAIRSAPPARPKASSAQPHSKSSMRASPAATNKRA